VRATRPRALLLMAALLAQAAVLAGEPGPVLTSEQLPVGEGPFTQAQCLDCHQARDPALVEQWRQGPHGRTADCVACHGERHGALPAARADGACAGCHAGPATHSYTTSKHGVLVRIGRPDWTLPLSRGNHRAPGCAYCHLHDRDHGDTMDEARGPSVRDWVCGGCHAPRFVREQLEAGERLTEVARVKREEADGIAARHPAGVDAVADLLASAERHRRNVRLGAGHQSPDYQWWHGQPALDGDLIRLRDAVALTLRQRAAAASATAPAADDGP
jgi:hypothetical protein